MSNTLIVAQETDWRKEIRVRADGAALYGWFPVEVQGRLKEINPVIGPNYLRANRHHQHFQDDLELALLMHH